MHVPTKKGSYSPQIKAIFLLVYTPVSARRGAPLFVAISLSLTQ